MQTIIKTLQGKKTYLVSAVTVLTAIIAYLNGTESLSTALTSVPGVLLFVGSLTASMRAAIAKVELALKAKV